MNEIWAKRLIAGTQSWDDMPASRKEPVAALLKQKASDGEITGEQYKKITGQEYAA